MAEKVMNNVREKLSKSRELCPAVSERACLLADYMSEIAPDRITPLGMAVCLARAVRDISQEWRWRKIAKKEELCWQLAFIAKKVRNQAVNIPQMIDVIADKDFAKEFRVICKEQFNFDPPPYGTTKQLEEYPEYVKVAVDWWEGAILATRLGITGNKLFDFFVGMANDPVIELFSEKELLVFKTALADEIMEEITAWGNCTLSVDYHPCDALKAAGKKIRVHQAFGYPLKTSMTVWEHKVEARVGDGGKFRTLWTSK